MANIILNVPILLFTEMCHVFFILFYFLLLLFFIVTGAESTCDKRVIVSMKV